MTVTQRQNHEWYIKGDGYICRHCGIETNLNGVKLADTQLCIWHGSSSQRFLTVLTMAREAIIKAVSNDNGLDGSEAEFVIGMINSLILPKDEATK